MSILTAFNRKKRIKSVLQMDVMDCGVSCLKMISQYYGKTISHSKLKQLAYTGKDGTSLLAISEAAENLGYRTSGGKIAYANLSMVPLPCVLHWNQEHFVVLYKVKKKNFFRNENRYGIVDPAFGKKVYCEIEFKNKWVSTESGGLEKGVVLLLEPTEALGDLSEEEDTKGFKFVFSYFKSYRKLIFQLLLGLLVGSIIQLILPMLTQQIVDSGIVTRNISLIYLILFAQLFLIISKSSIGIIRRWILLHISARINISMVSDFFIKLMKLPMSYFDTKLTGDFLQRIEDHERVEEFLTVKSLEVIFSLFNLVVFGIVLFFYSKVIFITFFTGTIIYALYISLFLKKRRELDYRQYEAKAVNKSKVYELIHGMQEIKLQNSETRRRWNWEDAHIELFKVNISALKLAQNQEVGNVLINESKNVIITIVAALAVLNNEMTLGMMLATQFIVGQLSLPVQQLMTFIQDLQNTKISLERINEIHTRPEENKGKELCAEVDISDLCLNNVSFQYEGPYSPKVLKNVSIKIPKNKVTAIVGASGSGKTTLIKLLLQYYKPTEGEINIGNNKLDIINTTMWRNMCGAVMQDGFIFTESIAHNIAQSDYEINAERLVYAAKLANIHEFVMSLPLKYNTIIGKEGQSLSLGQKQRVLIARAIYKNPEILFFDEATNALDAKNEQQIVTNLNQFYIGKTVIIVAHRLSTVKNADQIIVLEDGCVKEIGNHHELVENGNIYYNLIKNQLELGN